MRHNLSGLYKLGGIACIASGLLFLSVNVLEFLAGPPPSSGADILAWIAEQRMLLAFVSELLFFALALLIPAVIALYQALGGRAPAIAATGCGLFAVAISLLAMLLTIHGRLIYPVFGLRIDTPVIAEFAVAIYYGGRHAVGLLFGIGTIALSLAMWRGADWRRTAYLGFAAG